MNRAEMYQAACDVANAAKRASAGSLSDSKQVLHVAISLIHADESAAKDAERAKAAKMPGRPR